MATEEKEDRITIYYWGKVNFRGSFPKLVCAYAGVNYTECKDGPEIQSQRWLSYMNKPESDRIFPCFAPPIVKVEFADNTKETLYLSQMPVGVQYLGRKFGLEPDNEEDKAHALMMVMNCNDILVEITRSNGETMWPVTPATTRLDQNTNKLINVPQNEEWHIFRNKRIKIWFSLFEEVLRRNANKNINNINENGTGLICCFGNKVSYADISIFHILDRFINYLYPNNHEWIINEYPLCYKLQQQISKNSGVEKFVIDHKDWSFCGGHIGNSIKDMIDVEVGNITWDQLNNRGKK